MVSSSGVAGRSDWFARAVGRGDAAQHAVTIDSRSVPAAKHVILHHICEVCSIESTLTPEDAYEAGWDYPPKMGVFGVVSPRICPNCRTDETVW